MSGGADQGKMKPDTPGWLEHSDWRVAEWLRVDPEFLGSNPNSLALERFLTQPGPQFPQL